MEGSVEEDGVGVGGGDGEVRFLSVAVEVVAVEAVEVDD